MSKPLTVTPWQVMQWRSAIKLESKGLRHSSGRSVNAHACRAIGLPVPTKREAVIAELDAILEACQDAGAGALDRVELQR